MTCRTVVLSSFDAYLDSEYPDEGYGPADFQDRNEILARFPYPVMLELSFAELDYANRWCWQQFGSPQGECFNRQSEYPTCNIQTDHCHAGNWAHEWLVKTGYNFGFNEWYFSSIAQSQQFLEFVPFINWGENFPK